MEHPVVSGAQNYGTQEKRSQTEGDDGKSEGSAEVQRGWSIGRHSEARSGDIQQVPTLVENRQINVFIKIRFSIISENIGIISRAFRHHFIIPEFQDFAKVVEEIYWKCKDTTTGKVNKHSSRPKDALRIRRIMRSTTLSSELPTKINLPILSTGGELHPAIGQGKSGLLGHKRVHNRRPEVFNRRRERAVHPAVVQQAADVRIRPGPAGSEPGPQVRRPRAQR